MTHADKKKSKHEAERHYSDVRRLARQELENELRQLLSLPIELHELSPEDAQEADSWTANLPLGQRPGWSWEQEQRRFRVQRPRRFELALKVDSLLCGVALGRISDRRVVISVHYISSRPSNHPLKGFVLDLTARYVEFLGVKLGCVEISIERPVDALLDTYKAAGFCREVKRGSRVVRLRKVLR
ncbi:hypothetical protein [Zoogloea ramigera]|jgi:hypothetical protein|uniref:hypothetical protein n=1 Tax=Zoogloea ramigera TaxID=350 RepID=UPI003FA2D120